MSRETVRMGVVGLGYWGPNLARNIVASDHAELTWLCDLDPDRLISLSSRYPSARATTRFEDVLQDDALDAVILSTPVSTHYALAASALAAGKHVLVEKPMAGSSAEAAQLAARAERDGLVLLPGHTFVYSPPVVKVRDLIQGGSLGDIFFISMSRVNLGLHQPDVSVIWDLGPHDFSILRYWLDAAPVEVNALTRACVLPDTPDVAFVNLRFDSGTIAHIELSWLAPSKLRRTTVVGSEKMVVYDDTSFEPIRVFDSGAELRDPESFGEFKLSYRTGDIVSPRLDPTEPLALQLEDFIAAIRQGTEPRSTAQFGVEVVKMIEAVSESLERGGVWATVA